MHYEAPASGGGDYTVMVFYGEYAPPRATGVRYWVTWDKSAADTKHNIPGVPLTPEGATGTLTTLTNPTEVYRVPLDAGEGLHLRMEPDAGGGDIDLEVFDAGWDDIYRQPDEGEDPTVAWSHASAGYPEATYFRAAATGDYYPRVSMWSGPEPTGYELTYRVTDPTTITALMTTGPVAYEAHVTVPGLLTEHDAPLGGQTVMLSTFTSGEWDSFARSETTSDTLYQDNPPFGSEDDASFALGSYKFNFYPATNMRLRVWYPGVFWLHTPANTDSWDLMVKASMPALTSPSTVTHGSRFTVSGTIKPKHSSGSACPIVLKVERRKSDGTYYVYKTVKTTGYNYSTYTKYSAKFSLPYTGTWRIRGYHAENSVTSTNGNAATYSAYKTVKAK